MNGRMLLVDDDETFRSVLSAALIRRGYEVASAADGPAALALARAQRFDCAVVDLRMPGPSGLTVVEVLARDQPGIRIVVLTGYASIATAVEAIKLGAVHYLTKPADADEIIQAFARQAGDVHAPVPDSPPSVGRVEWEHIQRVLADCGGNISEAARKLGMHRRSLQRKLHKRPVRD
ncbi:MAG: Photosynthetic apparatus regulatory protein RegA [Gammaproteobacteria bacterium]|nr:Photosynthetic apparatus regulatory protein RegA [Gammaproteobacteria bacterium]